MFVDGVFKRRRSSSKAPRKTSSNRSMRSKSTSSLPHKRTSTWNDVGSEAKRFKNDLAPLNYVRHSVSSDVSDTSYIEEEIPPYSGGLKQDLSWNSLLTDCDTDFCFKETVDTQGIVIDHNFRVVNSPFTSPNTMSPPPHYGGEVFIPDDNLDLTIRGIGLMPSQRMPPSPPRMHSEHPWAEESPDDVMASLDFIVSQDISSSY